MDCCTDGRIVVSVDTGSIFAEKVGVGMTVEGSESASITRGKGYGERVGMEDSASITTWLVLASGLVGLKRGWIEVSVGRMCFC